MNSKAIVKIQDNHILLDSGMDAGSFGKTNYAFKIGLKTYAAVGVYKGNSFDFKFVQWQFSSTKILHSDIGSCDHVFFEGDMPEGEYNTIVPLAELLTPDNEQKTGLPAQYAAFAACSAITRILTDNLDLAIPGAGGIIAGENTKTEKITLLFLPAELFSSVASNFNDTIFSSVQGYWVRQGLSEEETNSFIRSAVAYTGLTGKLPYSGKKSDDRQVDMLDHNFIPLSYMINGVSRELADAVDNGLCLGPVNEKNEKKKAALQKDFPLNLLAQELGLQDNLTIKQFSHQTDISDEEFIERRENLKKKQQGKIVRSRQLRRNTTLFATISVAFVILIIIFINTYKTKMEKPTSQGLTSKETVTAFYEGIHYLDMDRIQYLSKGKSSHRYSNSVSTIYVTDKMRSTYEHIGGPFTPEVGMYYLRNTNPMIYGLTNFKINGEDTSLYLKVPTRGTAGPSIKQEYGSPVQSGGIKLYTVSFYLVYTEGENNDIYAAKNQDFVEVTFEKGKWIVSNITTKKYKELTVDSEAFKSEFKSNASKYSDYAKSVLVVRNLRSKYPWLPTDKALSSGLLTIQEENKDFIQMQETAASNSDSQAAGE